VTRALTDETRQQLADDLADLATAFAVVLVVRSNGLNLVDRMREQAASQIRAASYEGSSSGGGSEIPNPTYAAMAAGDVVDVEEARRWAEEIDADLQLAHAALERMTSNAARFLPRPARPKEAEQSELDEANRDAGCESCARVLESNGTRRYRSTYATGRVASKSEAEERGTERRRRAFLTGEDNRDRLAVDTRLCRGCLEAIKRRVPPGMQMTLGMAYPLKDLRARIAVEQAPKERTSA
jgi:hypothetical protein